MNKKIVAPITLLATLSLVLLSCAKSGGTPPNVKLPAPIPPSGNTAVQSDNVLQSDIALQVQQPADGLTLNTNTVTVAGKTVPKATVSINDDLVTADASGNFSLVVNLVSGPNAIDIIATDDNGKQGEVLLIENVELAADGNTADGTTAFPLKVTYPADGAALKTYDVTVTGQSTPGSIVTVNEETDIADDNGNFSIAITLTDGPNAIDVMASDDNGNEEEVILTVDVTVP